MGVDVVRLRHQRFATIVGVVYLCAFLGLTTFLISKGGFPLAPRIELCLLLACIGLCTYGLVFSFASLGPLRRRTAFPSILAAYSLTVSLACLEAVFCFLPRSHGVGYTYAARNFVNRYWHTNRLGYRDRDFSPEDLAAGKARILVVGDSFVAGHGTRDPKDRFADLLGARLSNTALVFNLGKNGAGTRTELEMLRQFPHAPDLVVLSYYENDVVESARAVDRWHFKGFEPYEDLDPWVASIIGKSYLLNFIYWSFPHGDTAKYVGAIRQATRDPEVMATHLQDLQNIVAHAKERGVPLLVVLFPNLIDIQGSREQIDRVESYFSEQGVRTLDIGSLVQSIPESERIVNSNDSHPSVKVHAMVADALYEALKSIPLGPANREDVGQASGAIGPASPL